MGILKIILTVLLSLAASSAWAANYCTDINTAGGWKLDETSGPYTDCTTNGNTGTVNGTVNQADTLKYGNAAEFTAVNNSYISFGSATVLDNIWDGGGTFSAWVGLDSAGTAGTFCSGASIVSKGDADGWQLCVNTNGSLLFSSKWAGGNVTWTTTTNPFSGFDGLPKHVMVYYNSDSDANDPVIRVDCSTLSVTESAAPFGTRNTDAAINLILGLDGAFVTSSGELAGAIDDVLLYDGDATGDCAGVSAGIDGSGGGGPPPTPGSVVPKVINGAVLNGFVSS